MSAHRRTRRDERRRRLGQNFLRADVAERFVREAGLAPGERVVEIGPGTGAVTLALAQLPVRVVAVELDPVWADRLRSRLRAAGRRDVRVVVGDFRTFALPREPFRVVASLPFGSTTEILARLLDDPATPLQRADVILQWEVVRKRAVQPPATLRSAAWAPWWEFRAGRRIPARCFRPVPRVDAGVLTIERRRPAMLPDAMAARYARFVRSEWPFDGRRRR